MPTTSSARRGLTLLVTALVAATPLVASPAASARTQHPAAKPVHAKAKHAKAKHAKAKHAKAKHAKAKRCRPAKRHRRSRCAHAALVVRKPSVHFSSPHRSTKVAAGSKLTCTAAATGSSIAHVDFYLDKAKLATDRAAPYHCNVGPAKLKPGSHALKAVAVAPSGSKGSATVTVKVPDTASSQGSTPNAVANDLTGWNNGDSWSDSFESGNFSTGWSWWGQGQEDIWGHISIVNPHTEGIPSLGGNHVARFQTTADDIAHGRINAKLYRGFETDPGNRNSRPPSDVSGTYSAWYYFPSSYRVPDHTWANIFQFKEQYRTSSGEPSDPLWWVQLGPVHWASDMAQAYGDSAITGRSDAPVAFINNYNSDWNTHHNFVPLPLDRWFQIRAVLHQHDRIDFYLDGKPLDTAHNSVYPVSPFHGADSMAWTFGVGNYSTGDNGPMYIDRASYAKL